MMGQTEADKLLEDLRRDARIALIQKMLKPFLWGSAAVVALVLAWAFYQHKQHTKREAVAIAFESGTAEALPPPYAILKLLAQAQNAPDAAAATHLLTQAADAAKGTPMHDVVLLKQAMQALSHNPAQIDALLQPIDAQNPLNADADELRFLAAIAQKNTEQAQKIATQLLKQPNISPQRQERIAIMQQALATESK